jgi:hypothetical protein
MKQLIVMVLGVLMLSAPLTPASASVSAAPTPPYLKELAKQMRCKYGEPDALSGAGRGTEGWHCVVGAGSRNRVEYYIMRPGNVERALDFYRDWVSCTTYDYEDEPCEPGYIARKGRVLIVDQANDPYEYEAAEYAARKTGGRIVAGYRYEG